MQPSNLMPCASANGSHLPPSHSRSLPMTWQGPLASRNAPATPRRVCRRGSKNSDCGDVVQLQCASPARPEEYHAIPTVREANFIVFSIIAWLENVLCFRLATVVWPASRKDAFYGNGHSKKIKSMLLFTLTVAYITTKIQIKEANSIPLCSFISSKCMGSMERKPAA